MKSERKFGDLQLDSNLRFHSLAPKGGGLAAESFVHLKVRQLTSFPSSFVSEGEAADTPSVAGFARAFTASVSEEETPPATDHERGSTSNNNSSRDMDRSINGGTNNSHYEEGNHQI